MPDDNKVPSPPPGFHPVTQTDDIDLSAGLVPKGVTLDMSKSVPLTPAVTLDLSKSRPLDGVPQPPPGFHPVGDIDLSAGLVPKSPAEQAGAYQTRKGGPVLNANTPPAPISRSDEVAGVQTAIHSIAPAFPGGEATAGVVKGLYQTGLGGASLLAKALNKAGIHSEEVDLLARGDVSPFSEAMTTPEGAGQHVGTTAEEIGEWIAGEEGIKALQGLAKLPQAGKLVKSLLNIGKAATLGAAQGGVKGAAKGWGSRGGRDRSSGRRNGRRRARTSNASCDENRVE
jgi:hypothetical protein